MKFPFARFQIEGESMLPTFKPNDRVLLFRWAKIRPGDVVVFYREGMKLIKRAIEKTSSSRWMVKGDNIAATIDSADFGEVSGAEILGKVIISY